ncbi:DUF2971 domain-containing protein [Nitrosospira lacus]|uniref:DUF2971 domain-containing protein n=2 Tax=Nitrosospira lacus TaxID=1288494 RepID=A0A1W6SSG5_9PROT|nr:DUF2971 domain-containing protein [Nitrosospira lacus]
MSMLYHYTSQTGIIGIIQSRSIWATHAMALNDSSEFFHSLSFAREVANGIFEDDGYLSAFGWAVHHSLESVSADDLYLTSFSEKPDLLSQWRGYCPAGAGLCLGFDSNDLETFCERQGYKLEKCIYEHQDQIKQIHDLVERCLNRFPKPPLSRDEYKALTSKEQVNFELDYRLRTSQGPDKLEADAAVTWLCAEIAKLAPQFKNEGFHEEAEWRIIAKEPKEQVKFRASSSYLAPYVGLEILISAANTTLREVIIGPNPNQARCEASVKALLTTTGLDDVELRRSSLPYNNW